jgi:uncharacterized protein (DUF3820 family)
MITFNKKEVLTKESKMPYGKYRDTLMKDIPSHYLMHLYDNEIAHQGVKEYVEENFDELTKAK